MMIIGQEMADIRHRRGGAVRSHFWRLCGVAGFGERTQGQKKSQFLPVPIFATGVACFLRDNDQGVDYMSPE
jgi:hypothetical protein